ncbi:MAG: hypothetical protein DCC55_37985 [Chloroflexi bacterium]|nr:MAG: hypothetical protein DCC55_37985 [Chloroflexota bacterium]
MLPFYAAYYEVLRTLFNEIEQIIDRLPQTALDWSPGADMNSVSVLTTHLVGSTRYWIVDVAGGRGAADRDRASEFSARGKDGAQLKAQIAAMLDQIERTLSQLELDDLVLERAAPLQGRSVNAGWALAHALAHVGTHLGHIQMTQQLWEARQPYPVKE